MTTKKNKIFDIVQPKNNWERKYAHLEYLRVGLYRILSKTIHVRQG